MRLVARSRDTYLWQMILCGSHIKRLIAALRQIPVLAWLVIQISMTGMPVSAAAEPHPPEITALFEALGTEQVVLCTPDGKQVFEKHDQHADHNECQWCQGFGSAALPTPQTASSAIALTSLDPGFRRNTSLSPANALQVCHPSRAPPALI